MTTSPRGFTDISSTVTAELEALLKTGAAAKGLKNLYTELMRKAKPTKVAIRTLDGLQYSYHDLSAASARMAHFIRSLGLAPGSRVAARVEKSPEALMLYLACLRSGMVFLPLNTGYQSEELRYFFNDAKPGLVVCDPSALGWIAPLAKSSGCHHVETLGSAISGSLLEKATPFSDDFPTLACGPDALAAILYTSGTTGRSKGAMLTHANLASNALVLHHAWHWQESDVLIHALPIFHVHGLFVAIHGALWAGAQMVWMSKFDAGAVAQECARATVLMGVPTFYVRLVESGLLTAERVKTMRLFISGSAPLLAETHQAFTQLTGQAILERYGMSETIMLTSNPYKGNRRAGTVGFALPSVELRLVDDQETPIKTKPGQESAIGGVQVRGPNVFAGYWNMPEKTKEEFAQGGWFKTGDMGQFAADGYLVLVGRSKDLIISGGYNVYPKEIELLLDDQPEVYESAVIGLSHPDFGEAVAAVVVPDPPEAASRMGPLDEAKILSRLRTMIAGFKLPKRLFFLPELPRNAMGKVQKNLLRERFASTFSAG
jgi:malonyl-CoA/methylmalonyl-CoA synthetase